MSGGLLSLLCLALGAAIWTLAQRPKLAGRPRAALIAVGVLAAPALLVGCLAIAWAAGRFGEFRLTLDQVTAEVRQFPMTLGGDADADDIVTPRMAPSVAAVLPDPRSGAADAPLVLQIAGSETAPPAAVIAVREGRETRFPTALPFGEGDALCVAAPCEADGARWAVLRDRRLAPATWRDGRVYVDEGAAPGPAMPGRKTLLKFDGVSEWTPAQAVHPLRDYFPHEIATPPGGIIGDCDRWVCAGPRGQRAPVRSVLFQKGGLGGSSWSVILADPGARVARADGADGLVAVPYAAPAPIPLGDGLRVDLWDIRYIDAPLDEPEARRGMLQLRRSLTLAERRGKAEVRFDTPPTQVIGACGAQGDASLGLPQSGSAAIAMGGRTAQSVGAVTPSMDARSCARFTRAAFQVPAAGEDALRTAHFNLERLLPPWPMAGIAVLWAAAVLAAGRGVLSARPAVWALFCVLQFLLALRFLFGLSGAAADPSLDWRAIAAEGAVAYVALPAALLAWARWRMPRQRGEWLLDLAPLAAAACGILWTGELGATSVMALGVWAFAFLRRHAGAPVPKRPGALDRAFATLARLEARWPAGTPSRLGPAAGLGLLTAALAGRLLAGAFGWKERIDLGVMVLAISVIYTPLLVVGFSRLLAVAQDAPRSWLRPVVFYLFLVAATFALPFAVRDSGYALMFAPIAGMAAWCAWSNRRALGGGRAAAALWAAPALAVLVALVALPTAGAMSSARAERLGERQQIGSGLTDAEALEVLDRQARASQNVLRLYLLGAPEALAAAGSAEAESLKVWSAQLADYTGSLWGRGYLTSPNLTALKAVQNTDNLTAIQLMSPFGRMGAALLLSLLALLPLALAVMTRPKGPSDWRRVCGFMALWCVFGAAAYMTLANLQLVPFTGRNAYLLAATSGGDLLEGAVLFFLAAWGVAAVRRPGSRT